MTINGWNELQKVTGLSNHMLNRFMKLYEFPKPIARERLGKARFYVWDRKEVEVWVEQRRAEKDKL